MMTVSCIFFFTRWRPHLLTGSKQKQRVPCSKESLRMFGPCSSKRLYDAVIGSERWLLAYLFMGSKTRQPTRCVCECVCVCGGGDDTQRLVVPRVGLQIHKTPPFSPPLPPPPSGPVIVVIQQEKSTFSATYDVNTVLSRMM